MSNEINLKLMIIGDSDVGKSSIILKYIENKISETANPTIGLESFVKTLKKNGLIIKLQIWDTAGQERFRSLTKNFYRNVDGIIFVFDLTNKDSFINITQWIQETDDVDETSKRILVGNKCDLEYKRLVNKEEIENFCKNKNMSYVDSSVINGTNIDKIFDLLVDMIIENKSNEELLQEYGIKDQNLNLTMSMINNESMVSNHKKKCCIL